MNIYSARIMMVLTIFLMLSGFGGNHADIFTSKQNKNTGVAIEGYDTVAYFTKGGPVKGSAEFTHRWKDADWHFASAQHRDLFIANPEKYAPQYGGYCALAVSKNGIAPTEPEQWVIYKDKLYLNFNYQAHRLWNEKLLSNIVKADENWPDVLGGW